MAFPAAAENVSEILIKFQFSQALFVLTFFMFLTSTLTAESSNARLC